MQNAPFTEPGKTWAIPLLPLTAADYRRWRRDQEGVVRDWVDLHHFEGRPGTHCIIPRGDGQIAAVLAGITETPTPWCLADLPGRLPAGTYRIEDNADLRVIEHFALGWWLGSYRYSLSSNPAPAAPARLKLPHKFPNRDGLITLAESLCLARDWINAPANLMTTEILAETARTLATEHGAHCRVLAGDQLLKANYPLIHAVGRASVHPPQLIDITWGNADHPKLTLVGKGVCFDSGGLDLKPASGMQLMKKDMGGAACVLALARIIMRARLPVRLRVLVPAVENSVSGNAFRPLDVLQSRAGKTIEIGNTDAEGRLILADALTEADNEYPDMIIDFATLTGAARTALGPDMPAFFTTEERLATQLARAAEETYDPLWRMPLHPAYADMLKSRVADLNSAPDSPYAGAITAALFLKHFVPHTKRWAHIDLMAWNPAARPGRPTGGEAQAVRAVWHMLQERYAGG